MSSSGYGPPNPYWSSDEYSPHTSPALRVMGLTMGVGALGAGLYFAKNKQTGENLTALDMVQNTLRRYGHSSPFALLNTFRSAEFLSPFVSTGSLGIPLKESLLEPGKKVFQYLYEPNYLKREETQKYLFKLFEGLEEKLFGKGSEVKFNFGMFEDEIELVFESDPKKSEGKAFLRRRDTGETFVFHERASLFEISETEASKADYKIRTKSNTAFYAINQASGLVDDFGQMVDGDAEKSVDQIFRARDKVEGPNVLPQKRFAIMPSPTTKEGASVFTRAFPAFGMERLNRLLLSTFEQIPILGSFSGAIDRAFGFDFKVKSGTASKQFARYGLRAGAVGAALIGIEQLDYYRRNIDGIGDVAVSGLFSLGIASGYKRIANATPVAAAAVGAAAFVGQMILPGFEEGMFPGIATIGVNLDVATTAIGEVTFANSYRRFVEGIAPGISEPTVGVFVGAGLAIASGMGRDPISSKIFRRLSEEQKGFLFGQKSELAKASMIEVPFNARRLQDINLHKLSKGEFLTEGGRSILGDKFLKEVSGFKYDPSIEKTTVRERMRVKNEFFAAARKVAGEEGVNVLEKELSQVYSKSLAERKELYTGSNILNTSYLRQVEEIDRMDVSGIEKGIRKTFSKLSHAFFGASFQGEEFIENAKRQNVRSRLGRFPLLVAAGLLAQQFVTGGLLGSLKTADEKAAEYSGKKLVDVRRGRWWEGGGTPFEGRDIMYHRPHAYAQLMSRSRQKAIFGEDEDEISPIGKFFLKNFTYEIERRNYYERPYPITGAAFEDIPVIGGILAASIGQIIKPTKLMHAEEFLRVGPSGEIQYKNPEEIDAPAYSLGGKGFGRPDSPHSLPNVLGNLQYQFRELEGLTGWAKNMFTKFFTGEETFGIQRPVMESASMMASVNKDFWDMELGGALLLSEPLRRFLPKERSMINKYNPITNMMPSWLPERFHYGDPYRNIGSGSVRLPGPGYAALHPELKGLSPEEYPDLYKYRILSDVAPTSREFKQLREGMYRRRAEGSLSQKEAMLMDEADKMLNQRMVYQDFQPNERAIEVPFVSAAGRSIIGGGIDILKDTISPMEYMVPMGFRPSQKLLDYSNPIDQYEYQRLYGTMFSFWDKPIRDWFRPAFYSAAHAMGYDGNPAHRQRANEVNEHFDKLEFYKQMQLASQAEARGDRRAKEKHLYEASRTRYGINPQASAMAIYQSLPAGEKEFFDAFSAAKGRERERILEMVPRDQAALYKNLYDRIDRGDRSLYPGSERQVDEAFLTQRFYDLEGHFESRSLPNEDWVGWQEDADLNDIKVRYADRIGMDLYDLDMYQSKLRAQSRRGYLDGATDQLMMGRNIPGASGIMNMFRNIMNVDSGGGVYNQVNVFEFGGNSRGEFYVNDDRRFQIMEMMKYASE